MTIYRREVRRQLAYGTLGQFISLQKERNRLLVEIGCTPYTVLSPAFGTLHELSLEAQYDSLADYEREAAVIASTPAIAALDVEAMKCVVQGGASDRLSKVVLATEEAL